MNTWLVRPIPHGTNRIREFRAQNIIAIGWPNIGTLTGLSREDLKSLLSGPPYNLSGLELGNAYATVDIFVNQMQKGDIVLVANGDDIYFAELTSDYQFNISVDPQGYSHQRHVKWLSDTSRKKLSKELRSSLKVHRTTANLSHHVDEIKALAAGTPVSNKITQPNVAISVSYPLRSDFSVEFKIPANITKTEAERLSIYLRSLYFTE